MQRLSILIFYFWADSALAQPIGTQAAWGPYLLQYADPVDTYPHGVFGEPIEPTTILDLGAEPYFTAPLEPLLESYVFEDRLPRFVDMDGDGVPELLTIVTNPRLGASVWLWDRSGQVRAKSAFHGLSNRWLNPVLGSMDMDGDGDQEIIILRTPHIGSVLEVLTEHKGQLNVVVRHQLRAYGLSNHAFGEAALNTSIICEAQDDRVSLVLRKSPAHPFHSLSFDRQQVRFVARFEGDTIFEAPSILDETLDKIDFDQIEGSCHRASQ